MGCSFIVFTRKVFRLVAAGLLTCPGRLTLLSVAGGVSNPAFLRCVALAGLGAWLIVVLADCRQGFTRIVIFCICVQRVLTTLATSLRMLSHQSRES